MDSVTSDEGLGRQALERALGHPLAIRRVRLDALHLDPANARTHPERNLAAIQASLARFGQAEPLVVQAGTGRVVGGNGRLVAMRALGWSECDVVELAMDDLTATALAIALNRTAELAEWDEATLGRLLEGLKAEDALDGLGFDESDLAELLSSLKASDAALIEDPGPELPPEKPVSRLGDLWQLGEHRLLCGDSTKAEDLARVMAGESAVLMASDPPYLVNYDGNNRPIHEGKSSGKDWSHVYHEVDIPDFHQFFDGVLNACLPQLVPRAPLYLWHAHLRQGDLAAALERHGILFHQLIVWVKPTAVFTHCFFRWRHEVCAFGWRKGSKPQHGTAQLDTVWEVDWEGKQRVVGNEHPTQKPTRLFEIPMELHTRPGAIVLEPFSGSGSQLIAAEKLVRRCRAVEIEPAFVDVAIRRWEKATAKCATLEGRPYAQVAAERGVL